MQAMLLLMASFFRRYGKINFYENQLNEIFKVHAGSIGVLQWSLPRVVGEKSKCNPLGIFHSHLLSQGTGFEGP